MDPRTIIPDNSSASPTRSPGATAPPRRIARSRSGSIPRCASSGPVGVGKNLIAGALGHLACQHGVDVAFARADDFLRKLRQSQLDNSREAEMTKLTSVDLLIFDDFALGPMTKGERRDVHPLLLERTGRASMIVTSNRDTAE